MSKKRWTDSKVDAALLAAACFVVGVVVAAVCSIPQRVREKGYKHGEYGLTLPERAGKAVGRTAVDFGAGVVGGLREQRKERAEKNEK